MAGIKPIAMYVISGHSGRCRRHKFCDFAVRLDGLVDLRWRSTGVEGEFEHEMKTVTH